MSDVNTCVDCVTDGADHNAYKDAVNTVASGPSQTASSSVEPIKHNTLDPTTFIAPSHPVPYSVTIEFCNRCRWIHRASWTSVELMLTFPPPAINSVSLIPLDSEETGGRFRIWLYLPGSSGENSNSEIISKLVYDRKIEGGFPELKVLKQRVRDLIDPTKSLGHSDKGH